MVYLTRTRDVMQYIPLDVAAAILQAFLEPVVSSIYIYVNI